MSSGKLYLIPVPLGAARVHTLPPYVADTVRQLDVFVVERAKTARHFIKEICPDKLLPGLLLFELNEHTPQEAIASFLKPAETGQDIGLMSEAGCPGVADPGAALVKLAHEKGIEVIPLVGPSSILLALMASGMNGQSFCFHGYLPAKRPELERVLKNLEQLAIKHKQTQLFIEAPYRNQQVMESACKVLAPSTYFGIAMALTLPDQWIKSQQMTKWREAVLPELHKRPAVFMIGV